VEGVGLQIWISKHPQIFFRANKHNILACDVMDAKIMDVDPHNFFLLESSFNFVKTKIRAIKYTKSFIIRDVPRVTYILTCLKREELDASMVEKKCTISIT
jgi:hypothetical protein